MNREELGRLYPIQIVPYDERWPSYFEQEKENLLRILGSECALRVEHIGSTAVPGLSAKPTIDILVEIPADQTGLEPLLIRKMNENNYIHMKEQKKHLMFVKGYLPTGLDKISFHIHMGTKEQEFLWDRICFRDYLRIHPDVAKEYERLKIKLAQTYKYDREAYTEAKTELVNRITGLAKEKLS